ncbi:hypothetical protein FAVG1_00995 [Fusarium avenaceum]|nr:hypothetical protein FAVG1_00995 [Fusarium avenaceum]
MSLDPRVTQEELAPVPIFGPGLVEQNVGELGTDDSNNPLFRMKRKMTNWFHVLMDIDGQLLPGFHPGTVARIGLGPCAGLHVRLQITAGQFSEARMHFQFLVRKGARHEKLTELLVPLANLLDGVSLHDISTDNAQAMATLKAFIAEDLSELAPQAKASDSRPPSATCILTSTGVIHNADFDRDWDNHPEAMRRIVSNVRGLLAESDTTSLAVWIYPEQTFNDNWSDILNDLTAEAKETDLDVYGITGDGIFRHHWVVIHLDKDFATSVPDIGHSCVFFLRVSHRERELPNVALSATQVSKIVKSMVWRFKLAETKSSNILLSMEKEAEAARSNDDETKAQYLEGLIDQKSENSFIQIAGQSIFELLRFPSSKSVTHLPKDAPSVQRAHTASLLALKLRQNEGEYDPAWFSRIQAWVTKSASTTRIMSVIGRGLEYQATRIPLPTGTQANLAIFSVVTGRQTNWPPGLVKPPVLSKIPTIKPSRKLHYALNNMFKPGYYDKEEGKFVLKAECRSITLMKSPSESGDQTRATSFFQWSDNFQARPVVYNFLQRFPGLARAFDAGEFNEEVSFLVEALKAVPYGWAFVTGGPGSGKTTSAMSLVRAIISASTNVAIAVEHVKKDDSVNSCL